MVIVSQGRAQGDPATLLVEIEGVIKMKRMWLCVMVAASVAGNANEVTLGTSGSPYGFALDYCEGKGGLARFTFSDGVYTFSCGSDLSELIRITR